MWLALLWGCGFDRVGLVLVSDSPEDTLRTLGESVGADAVVSKRNVTKGLVATIEKLAADRCVG